MIRAHSRTPAARARTVLPSAAPARPHRSNQQLQAKLKVGPVDDSLEHEADGIAERVVQRRCAACRHDEEEPTLRLKPASAPRVAPTESAIAGLAAGMPLPATERSFFERRLGQDLSGVRVHAEHAGAVAIGARAFTLDRSVAFAPGEWRPGTVEGRRLLAHELAHVLQQEQGAPQAIRRQATPSAGQRTSCVGDACFEDTPGSTRTSATRGTIEGSVDRREYVRGAPTRVIHDDSIQLSFNPGSCELVVPHVVRFQQPPSGTWGTCLPAARQTTAVPNIPAARMTSLQNEFIRLANERMNGWYEVHLEGTGCPACARSRNIPIRVRVGTDFSQMGVGQAPVSTVTPVNRGGRSYVSGNQIVLCMGDTDIAATIPHEAVHFALRHGDEYRETDAAVAAAAPRGQYSPEREIEGDSSLAGSHHAHGRFALLHERHFQFAPAYLEGLYPGCRATLVALSRPAVFPSVRLTLGAGYASISGLSGGYESLAIELGIPLDRVRRWQLTLGPSATFMAKLSPGSASRSAFLLGARTGIEYRTSPGQGGLRLGAFGQLGAGWFSSRDYGAAGGSYDRSARSMFGEAGIGGAYRFGTGTAWRFNLGAEAAVGGAMGTGVVGPVTADLARDPALTKFWRAGLTLGFEL